MSLVKIPLIVAFCYAFKKCLTAPNPAPPKRELLKSANFSPWYTQQGFKYAIILQYIAGLLETLTILASCYPGSALSRLVLSTFVFREGRAANLQPSHLTTLGAMLTILGTALRIATYRYLGKFFRFEASIQPDHQLITAGPYSVVRHPSYTGCLLGAIGWFLWTFGRGSWVRESGLWRTRVGKVLVGGYTVLVIFGGLYMTLRRMGKEDRALRKRFGVEWDEWASRVPYLLLPGVY